ncbi:MAG: D-alanyl-D-alanine carboxypeptidase [Litoreibacter sp.]|nr:D-alanyl-D-alanine carboxypeptidase [Litoreibacter sp.]
MGMQRHSRGKKRADVLKLRLLEMVRAGLFGLLFACLASVSYAAPYAAMVVDARSGEVLHSRNADTRLHPASLTKMMTLYIAFEAIEKGEISLDTKVKISRKAAAEQPSKLGLKSGQRIALRYLIRAAAVKSANDAATAIGEALSGSEAAFARRMTRTAKALGMTRTTFKNAHGLTEKGHLSTARDMTTLGRHVLYDYPQYYNLFSRKTTHAGVREVSNTNRRLLGNYRGADGIKTGYTRAAGFNLVASAERGSERIIATVFGGRSTATRNARVAELLDIGFKRAPSRVALRKPALPTYDGSAAGIRITRAVTVIRRSPRPAQRPGAGPRAPNEELLLAIVKDVESNVSEARDAVTEVPSQKELSKAAPRARATSVTPIQRPQNIALASLTPQSNTRETQKSRVITRASTSGGRHWGISLGKYTTRDRAERVLLKTALQEIETLDEALRKVVNRPQGWEANFVGMTEERANLACVRLSARNISCETRGPAS